MGSSLLAGSTSITGHKASFITMWWFVFAMSRLTCPVA